MLASAASLLLLLLCSVSAHYIIREDRIEINGENVPFEVRVETLGPHNADHVLSEGRKFCIKHGLLDNNPGCPEMLYSYLMSSEKVVGEDGWADPGIAGNLADPADEKHRYAVGGNWFEGGQYQVQKTQAAPSASFLSLWTHPLAFNCPPPPPSACAARRTPPPPPQLDIMVKEGLRPHHVVADVGCGALRAGMALVPYLQPTHYYGLDINGALLEAGYEKEIRPNGLAGKLPRGNLKVDANFNLAVFGTETGFFDFVLIQSILTHIGIEDVRKFFRGVAPYLKPGGVVFCTFNPIPENGNKSLSFLSPGTMNEVTYPDKDPFHFKVGAFNHPTTPTPPPLLRPLPP
jgi:hypothetical protein